MPLTVVLSDMSKHILHTPCQMKVNSFILDLLQAKRDPYRFRFPLEMRLVDPNIDHLLYVFSSRIPSLFFIKIFFVILVSFTSLIG